MTLLSAQSLAAIASLRPAADGSKTQGVGGSAGTAEGNQAVQVAEKSAPGVRAPAQPPAPSDSLQSRFPESHQDRCTFCSERVGSGGFLDAGGDGRLYHVECWDQLERRKRAEHKERALSRQLPTCLCGATIFRSFKVKDFSGGDRVCCGECYLKLNPQPVKGGSEQGRAEVEREGGHPVCWPEDSWMDATDGER